MTNVLLTKEYKSRPVGTILTDVSAGEAKAIEAMNLGEILTDEPEKPAKKGEKAAASE